MSVTDASAVTAAGDGPRGVSSARLAYLGDETTPPTRRRRDLADLVTDVDDEGAAFGVVERTLRAATPT
ncbi:MULTISPECIES: hypothetical protein [unclassified Frankia]|uniref:hypothetical protein n=1 Tax=unclassified Frankia TaxID=2632575 RepID=UPI001EF6B825|nr:MULTISPECIES: hypothetical protein [unclassified Frankia]